MKPCFMKVLLIAPVILFCNATFAGEDATQCVQVRNNGTSVASFINKCNYDIEIAWCYVGKDCKHGNWGYSNTWSFRAGATRPATTFSSNISGVSLVYAACKGANSSIKEVGNNQHYCK